MDSTEDGSLMPSVSSIDAEGSMLFRHRLVCSLLSGKGLHISNIRGSDEKPGLRSHEASFLRLLDKVTNGTEIVIDETGTELSFQPGVIVGGKHLTHDCGTARSIAYYLEGLLCILPLAKQKTSITLSGITNSPVDPSVDVIRTVSLPLLHKFGVEETALKITKRGAPPKGGGEVTLEITPVKSLQPVQLTDEGVVKKIRGIAFCARISPEFANRMVATTHTKLKTFIPDVFVHTDHYKGREAGLSPGFGLSLVAESTTGQLVGADVSGEAGQTPEEVAEEACRQLLAEIKCGSTVDTVHQSLACIMMIMCPEHVSSITVGELSNHTIELLRFILKVFGVRFRIVTNEDRTACQLTCLGVGYVNLARRVF